MLTFAEIQAINAARAAADRKRDAERLAAYQAECLASWGDK